MVYVHHGGSAFVEIRFYPWCGANLKEACDTERQLLNVACTRAWEFPVASGVQVASEFLEAGV